MYFIILLFSTRYRDIVTLQRAVIDGHRLKCCGMQSLSAILVVYEKAPPQGAPSYSIVMCHRIKLQPLEPLKGCECQPRSARNRTKQ